MYSGTNSNSWQIIKKKIVSIIYYFMWLIDTHVVKGPIIIKGFYYYLESLFINIGNFWYGVYVVKKKARQEGFEQG